MALRNYLYAKHGNTVTSARINKINPDTDLKAVGTERSKSPKAESEKLQKRVVSAKTQHQSTGDDACKGRELVLEDGTKQCRQCSDCPKNAVVSTTEATPRVVVEVEVNKLASNVEGLHLSERRQEIDFTNVM